METPVATDDSIPTVTDVACTVCGCVCDDLSFEVRDNQIVEMHNVCALAQPWFEAIQRFAPPAAELNGIPCSVDEALVATVEILRNSRAPLIYGLSGSSTPGQRAAVRLADLLGATIDTTASVRHAASLLAMQQVGEATCSLGEVRQRADLVIFWKADPLASHPRHLERYSLEPASQFLPRGRDDRTLIVIDSQSNATSSLADLFLQVQEDRDFEMICGLRQLVRGDVLSPDFDYGIPHDQLVLLAERLKSCRYGAFFYGPELGRPPLGHVPIQALSRLVAELHRHTRFTIRRMGLPGSLSGAENVLCWQTGFPFAVNLGRGYPRYNPGEFSANELLERGEVDACLFVGSQGVNEFSDAARQQLRQLPVIAVDPAVPASKGTWESPTVRFSTAVYGVHLSGSAYRMDEIPLPLRPFLDSSLPSDAETLDRISKSLADAPEPFPQRTIGTHAHG